MWISRKVISPTSTSIGIVENEAIDRLPSEQAELVRLIHWEGFTVVEAAGVLGISESTARGRYQRARANLAEDPTIRMFSSALTGRDP